MKSYRRLLIPVLFTVLLLGIKCEDDPVNKCAFTMCTEEFRMIVLSIRHANDNTPFQLSEYKVTRVSDNLDITPARDSYFINNGYYPVTNDLGREMFEFRNVELEFKGYLDGNMVVQKRFIVTADCCHISLVEGETSILL